MPRNQMTCREFVGLIGADRDGERSSAESFSQHSATCSRCSDYLKGYELTISAARRIGQNSSSQDSLDIIETVMPMSLVRRILDHRLKAPE